MRIITQEEIGACFCFSCKRDLNPGDAALEGSLGRLYCSPECYDKGEEDIDTLEAREGEEDDSDSD